MEAGAKGTATTPIDDKRTFLMVPSSKVLPKASGPLCDPNFQITMAQKDGERGHLGQRPPRQ